MGYNKVQINKIILLLFFLPTIFCGINLKATISTQTYFVPNTLGDPLGNKGVWVVDLDNFPSTSLTLGGGIADWSGLPWGILNGINMSIVFDNTYFYLAAQWLDTSYNYEVGKWNKTGMISPSEAEWQFLDGKDDTLQFGFKEGTNFDYMIWSASNRTQPGYMYECNAAGVPDTGDPHYLMNTNDINKLNFEGVKPLYDNDWNLIDEVTLPTGTVLNAWHDFNDLIPTGSQANTQISWDWNVTKLNHYTIEVKRLLDTAELDDISLDFNIQDLTFYIGSKNNDSTADMQIPISGFKVAIDNEPAELSLNQINNSANDSLLVSGQLYDDYTPHNIILRLGGGDWRVALIIEITGYWSYQFFYNPTDMPLGNQTIEVVLDPLYEEPIVKTTWVDIFDAKAPYILGVVNISERFTNGIVPPDYSFIEITAGINDNYWKKNNLTVSLFYWKSQDVAQVIPMEQYSTGSTTWIATIPIVHLETTLANYTYYVQVFDLSLNKQTSEKYWFLTATESGSYTPPPPSSLTTSVNIGPSIGTMIGSFILISTVLITLTKIKGKRG
ncbi:MAG TPA: hypothetical protein VMZ29_01080 [Candidatus Bathyarchaeia archaeon]|nr:hypothetical protein [Candidatus Bathyarchaeia archaeon]